MIDMFQGQWTQAHMNEPCYDSPGVLTHPLPLIEGSNGICVHCSSGK
jgi:hypothetical protein